MSRKLETEREAKREDALAPSASHGRKKRAQGYLDRVLLRLNGEARPQQFPPALFGLGGPTLVDPGTPLVPICRCPRTHDEPRVPFALSSDRRSRVAPITSGDLSKGVKWFDKLTTNGKIDNALLRKNVQVHRAWLDCNG